MAEKIEKEAPFLSALSDTFIDHVSGDGVIKADFIRITIIAERVDGRFKVVAQDVELGRDMRESIETTH